MDGVVAELSRLYVYSYNFYFFPIFFIHRYNSAIHGQSNPVSI